MTSLRVQLAALLLVVACLAAGADAPEVIPTEAPAYVAGGYTMIPFRALLEWMGAEILWTPEEQTVEARRRCYTFLLRVGQREAIVNGEQVLMDVPAVVRGDRTYVPLRFVAEALGAAVGWDAATSTATIWDQGREGILPVRATPPPG